MSIKQKKLLSKLDADNVIICFDNDIDKKENYGINAAKKLSKELKYLFEKVYIMKLPNKKDPADCLKSELIYSYKNIEEM